MIKIRLLESEIHRNETTFRPFVTAANLFREVGIEFTKSNDYDYAFVGQASIIDKKVSLEESVDKGLKFLEKVTGEYIIIDGQDSHSLIGTADVLRQSNAVLMLKNVMLADKELYKEGTANGRYYWGQGFYWVPDLDELLPRIKLSGCNWLSTVMPNWLQYGPDKEFDISCMFGYPTPEKVFEHELCQTDFYDEHRRTLMRTLGDKYKIAKLINGERVSLDEYYYKMYNSKIIMAPLGYGAMAPRDLESSMFGSVLIKPKIDFLESLPNIYKHKETYIGVEYDWSDLIEKIDELLSDYKRLQQFYVENMRKSYKEQYQPEHFVTHIYNIFKELDGVVNE